MKIVYKFLIKSKKYIAFLSLNLNKIRCFNDVIYFVIKKHHFWGLKTFKYIIHFNFTLISN